MENIIYKISKSLKEEIKKESTLSKVRGIKESLIHEASSIQYAEAIFSLASEVGKIDKIKENLNIISETLICDKEIFDFFSSPFVEGKIKITVLNRVYKEPLEAEVFNMLYILLERNAFNLLPAIIVEYENIYNDFYNILQINLKTAMKINEKDIYSLKEKIYKITGREAEINVLIDNSLMAGIVIEADSVIYDYSIKSALERLKKTMLKTE